MKIKDLVTPADLSRAARIGKQLAKEYNRVHEKHEVYTFADFLSKNTKTDLNNNK